MTCLALTLGAGHSRIPRVPEVPPLMLKGLLTVSIAFLVCVVIGAVFGVFVGVLAKNILLWSVLLAIVGGGFGIAMGYGFLPEQ